MIFVIDKIIGLWYVEAVATQQFKPMPRKENSMKNRRVLGMVLALAMCLSMVIPAMASSSVEASDVNQVQPRAALCPDCGGSISHVSTVWGAWGVYKTPPCEHKPYGEDHYLERFGVSSWRCNRCYQVTTADVREETMECHGISYN